MSSEDFSVGGLVGLAARQAFHGDGQVRAPDRAG
jgi:hypothetical protein